MTELLTIRETATLLKISVSSLERLRKDEEIAFPQPVRIGGRVVFRVEDLNVWIAGR